MNTVFVQLIKYVKYENIPLNNNGVKSIPIIIPVTIINPPIFPKIIQYSGGFCTNAIKK